MSGASQEELVHIQRPGLGLYRQLDSNAGNWVRGVAQNAGLLGGQAIAAVAQTGGSNINFVKFNGTSASTLWIGVNDDKRVRFADTNFGWGVLYNNQFAQWTTGNLLNVFTIPDGRVPVDITALNSYLFVACTDGTFYWVEPNGTTIDALNFATAEANADGLVAIRALGDEVVMFGRQTIEFWQPTNDPDLVIVRASGRTLPKGCMARDTVQPIAGSLAFVGSDGKAYMLDGNGPQRISTVSIEERIRNRTGAPYAVSYNFDGHETYALSIPGVGTFAYDALSKQWSQFNTGSATLWVPSCACPLDDGTTLVGSSTAGRVLTFGSNINGDDGIVMTRTLSGAVGFNGGRQRNDNLEVHTGASADLQLRLRWHDGDGVWSPYVTRTARAGGDIVRYTQLGAAKQPYRAIEISTVTDATIRISGARANEGRAN